MLPAVRRLAQLKWIGQVVTEDVPSVADDLDKLEPRLGEFGVLSSSCHDYKQLRNLPLLDWRSVLCLWIVLIHLFELLALSLVGNSMVLEGLLELLELKLHDVVVDAVLLTNIQSRSLARRLSKSQELANAEQIESLRDPEERVELGSLLLL